MKIRNGFVSNSSSSSFIVLGNKNDMDLKDFVLPEGVLKEKTDAHGERKCICLPTKEGKTEFGWEEERTYGLVNKLNWCAIQILEMGTNSPDAWRRRSNFEDVIREVLGAMVYYDYNSVHWDSVDGQTAYIDHQSSSYEGENVDIFDHPEDLKNFLFNETSYIQGGNDNDGNLSYEYRESYRLAYGEEAYKERYFEEE